jgi:hypothetical protein
LFVVIRSCDGFSKGLLPAIRLAERLPHGGRIHGAIQQPNGIAIPIRKLANCRRPLTNSLFFPAFGPVEKWAKLLKTKEIKLFLALGAERRRKNSS